MLSLAAALHIQTDPDSLIKMTTVSVNESNNCDSDMSGDQWVCVATCSEQHQQKVLHLSPLW